MANASNPPLKDEFAVPADPTLASKIPRLVAGFKWTIWLSELVALLNKAPKVEARVIVPAGSSGSIGLTPFALGTVPSGVHRVTFRFRITRAATVSSALQFSVSYTDGAVALTANSTNETGNLTTSVQAGAVPIRVDANTAISYSTTYASVGATAMQYELDVILESLSLDTV